jgi:hypothetical protein
MIGLSTDPKHAPAAATRKAATRQTAAPRAAKDLKIDELPLFMSTLLPVKVNSITL